MRTIQNFRVAPNFWFYELMEGTTMPVLGHRMNWGHVLQCDIEKQMKLYFFMQEVRNWMNYKFRLENNNIEIGIEITSGFRCPAWERYKERNGLSRHLYDATDGRPLNVEYELSCKIIYAVEEEWGPKWMGGFAIAEPNPQEGKTGFFHFDQRGYKVRWTY